MPVPPFGERLADFESAIDASIDASDVWRLPRHLTLALLLDRVRDLMLGGTDARLAPRPEAGLSLMDRLPALVPYLRRCPAARDAGKVVLTFADGLVATVEMMSWAHAAELYPELWRGWRVVQAAEQGPNASSAQHGPAAEPAEDGETVDPRWSVEGLSELFVVDHPSKEAARWEVRDIVLARLAVPWGQLNPESPSIDDHVAALLDRPGIEVGTAAPYLALRVLGELRVSELDLVDDNAMRHVVGVDNAGFSKFRDGCVALGTALIEAATYCISRCRDESTLPTTPTGGEREAWAKDSRTWSLPMVSAADVMMWLSVLSGLDSSQVERLVGAFSEPHTGSGWATAAEPRGFVEGFFPPFWPVSMAGSSFILLSPWHLQSTVTRHSLISRFARTVPDEFDAHVSGALEPTLLRQVAAIWQRVPEAVVRTNRNWSSNHLRGEFDALVYDPAANTVVHIQAKASIPAVSPRMVARLEQTVAVGIRQLSAFRSLPAAARDRVLSTALGTQVADPLVIDVLVTSSGIGSATAWSSLGEVVPLNPVLLAAAVDSALASPTPNVATVLDHAMALLDGLVADAQPKWTSHTVPLGLGSDAGQVSVTFPSLSLDSSKLSRFRRLAWPS